MAIYIFGIEHNGEASIAKVMAEIKSLQMKNPAVFIEARPQDLGGFFPFKWWRSLTLELVKDATVIPLESRKRGAVEAEIPGELLYRRVPENIWVVKKHPKNIAREFFWMQRILSYDGSCIVVVGHTHADHLAALLKKAGKAVILDKGRKIVNKRKERFSGRILLGNRIEREWDFETIPQSLTNEEMAIIRKWMKRFNKDKAPIRITSQNVKKYTRKFLPRRK